MYQLMWENIPFVYIRNKGEIEKVGIARYKPKPLLEQNHNEAPNQGNCLQGS